MFFLSFLLLSESYYYSIFAVVQLLTHVQLFATPWTAACQAFLSFVSLRVCPNSCPLNWWCHPTISSSVTSFSHCPQSFPASRVLSNKSTLPIRWSKYRSFSFSVSHSNDYSWLISFKTDWFDLFGVQGTLKSLLQHHSSKASILRHSTFFTVRLPHLYMTTGKTIALTRWTFVGKIMSLLFNTLSRFERSPGEGNGNLLQYPCLKNPMDGWAW